MLDAVLREAHRYEVMISSLDAVDRPGIRDQYTGVTIVKGGEKVASEVGQLCRAMNIRGVKQALLWPTKEMIAAGGEGSVRIWMIMIEAMDLE